MSELTIMFVLRPEGDWSAEECKVIFSSEMGSLSSECIFKNTIPSVNNLSLSSVLLHVTKLDRSHFWEV